MRCCRYAVSRRSMHALCLACTAGALWILGSSGLRDMQGIALYGAVVAGMILLRIADPWNEELRIDAGGIRCCRRKRVLWSFSWDEIGQIRPVPVHRCRGYVIVPKQKPQQDLHTPQDSPVYTFEHTRKIRAALEQYAPEYLSRFN